MRNDFQRRRRWLLMLPAATLLTLTAQGRAQTRDDGFMLARHAVCSGVLYTHSSWDHYWEGTLERVNGNIGTIRTQSVAADTNYGLTKRINVMASVPYVWTHASSGVLRSMSGFQDLSLSAKVNALQFPVTHGANLRLLGSVVGTTPMTNYSPNLQPLSIGLHGKTLSLRGIARLQTKHSLYVTGSAAYIFRGRVTIAAPYYYTNNQLTLSNQVALPNQFNYQAAVGYYHHDLKVEANFWQTQTRGGGDIRRQDLPFISNRMNESRVGATVQYPLPGRLHNLQYWVNYSGTVEGRNVGDARTLTTGFMYLVRLERSTRTP